MRDKEKIRAEVERRYNYHRDHANDWAGTCNFWSAHEDKEILSFIDSMQKEPKFKVGDKVRYKYNNICTKPRIIAEICGLSHYVDTDNHRMDMAYTDANFELVEEPKKCMYSKDDYTDEDRKVLCDGCEEECKYSKSDDFTKALAECIHQAQGNVVDPMVLAETWKDELIKLAKSEEPVSEEWIKELRTKLDSLSKEDFKKVWAKYSRYGEEGSVDYNKLITMLNDALSKETKESWNKRLSEEHVSEGLEEEIDKYIKDHFTIDKEQLDRLGIEEKDYLYSMDRDDILAMVRHFTNLQKKQMTSNTADAIIGLPYENKYGGYTHLIDVSRPLPVGNNKIAIIFKED